MAELTDLINFTSSIFVLLPIVAILWQTMIVFYIREAESISRWRATRAFFAIFIGYILMALAAVASLFTIGLRGADIGILLSGTLLLIGLAVVGIGLWFLMADAIQATGKHSSQTKSNMNTRDDNRQERDG